MNEFLAPNGKPSNLTPEQYKLVRTPEFKAWFGDWENDPENSSKVIDKQTKEPLVVYHGTNADFTIFDTDEESENRKGGIWNAEYPDGYIFMVSDKKNAKYYGKRLIPLFVNLVYPTIKKVKKGESLVIPFDDEGLAYEGDAIVTDGIDYVVGTQDEYAVKLADGTNTTFDASNPDIRYDGGGNTQPKDLTTINNFKNIQKGVDYYSYSDDKQKQNKSDRWYELFLKNQKEKQITPQEYKEFILLSSELAWEDLGEDNTNYKKGGNIMNDKSIRVNVEYLEEQFFQLNKEIDIPFSIYKQYEKTGKVPREFLEELTSETGVEHWVETNPIFISLTPVNNIKTDNMTKIYAKGGKVIVLPADLQKYKKIGIDDKYFIEASKDVGLQGVNFDADSLFKKISTEFNNLLDNYESYLISEDSVSITNYIKNEIETKKERGASIDELQRLEASIESKLERDKIINEIAQTQKGSLIQWVEYLKQSNYSVSFKYLMLKAVLTFNYDLKQNKLYERGDDTIRNFTPFDAGSLAELYANQSDFLLRDYSILMNENSAKVLNSQEVIEKSGDGRWIKFKGGRNTKKEDIEKNGKELMQLVQSTYWCTKSAGTSQLRGGDFYVYVTESNGAIIPRIAVRMNEDEVGEVRGNQSSAQDLDAEMLVVAEEFLNKNIPNNSGLRWLNSIKFNKKVVEFRKRLETEGLFKDFMYEYVDILAKSQDPQHKVDYGENGNVTLLKETFQKAYNNLPNQIYKKTDIQTDYRLLTKETIYFIGSLGSYDVFTLKQINPSISDLSNWKLKVITYDFDCADVITNLGNIEYVGGNLILSKSTENLGKVKFVGNEIVLNESNISSLNQLEYIGKGLVVNSKIKDLGNLKQVGFLKINSCEDGFSFGNLEKVDNDLIISVTDKNIDFGKLKIVGGNFIANKTLITDLNELESVGGNFEINGSKIKVFSNLKTIGGNADFSNNFTSSTQNIETILGSVKFLNSRIMEFNKLKKIGGSIEFKGSFFKTFGSIEYIGGGINLAESKLEDLGNLEYVGGYVSFKGSKIVFLNKLNKIVGFANFDTSLVEDLGNLESIGGNAYFNQTKIKSIGKLNYIGGFAQFQGNKSLEEQWLKKINGK
jgi:hypothetical protein